MEYSWIQPNNKIANFLQNRRKTDCGVEKPVERWLDRKLNWYRNCLIVCNSLKLNMRKTDEFLSYCGAAASDVFGLKHNFLHKQLFGVLNFRIN